MKVHQKLNFNAVALCEALRSRLTKSWIADRLITWILHWQNVYEPLGDGRFAVLRHCCPGLDVVQHEGVGAVLEQRTKKTRSGRAPGCAPDLARLLFRPDRLVEVPQVPNHNVVVMMRGNPMIVERVDANTMDGPRHVLSLSFVAEK